MAIKHTIARHASAFPSKVLAHEGGAHIFNVQLTNDCDNGNIIRKGDYASLDLYKENATPASTMTGVIVGAATNGNWYVEITANPDHELFVYQVPMIAEDWTNNFKKESNFYNAAGSVVRAYDLCVGDIVEVSAEGFSTNTPQAGKKVTVASKKFSVEA